MKKFKGFLATALLALTVLAVSLSVLACDNNGGENYTLAVDPATVTVTAGENVTLSTNAPEGTQLKWKSSDENVATVAAGVVTGINAGAAKIIVQAGSQSAECSVTVTPAAVEPDEPVVSIGISANTLTVTVGAERTVLTATVYEDGVKVSGKTVTWKSSDSAVLTVDADDADSTKAYLSGVKSGSATVTASCGGKEVSCAVKVLSAPVTVTGSVNLITETGVSPSEVSASVEDEDGNLYDVTVNDDGTFSIELPGEETQYTLTAAYGSVKNSVTANIGTDKTVFPKLDLNAVVGGSAKTETHTWASAPASAATQYSDGGVVVNATYDVAWISGTGSDVSFKTSAVMKAASVGESDPSLGFIFGSDDGTMYYVCLLKARIRIYSMVRSGATGSEIPGTGSMTVTTHSNKGMEIVASNVFEGAVPNLLYNEEEGEYGSEYIFTVVKDGADYYFYLDPFTGDESEAVSMFFMLEEGKTIHTISANKSQNVTDIKMLANSMQLPSGKVAVGLTATNNKITGAFSDVSYTADPGEVIKKTGKKAVITGDEHVDIMLSGDVSVISDGADAGVYPSVGGYIFIEPQLDDGYALDTLSVTYGDGTAADVLPMGDKFFFYNVNNAQYTIAATSVAKTAAVKVSGTVNVAEAYKYDAADNTGSDSDFYKFWIGYVSRGYVPASGAIGYKELGIKFTDESGAVRYGTIKDDYSYEAYLPEGTYEADFFDYDHYALYAFASKFKVGGTNTTFAKINRLEHDLRTDVSVSGSEMTLDGNLNRMSLESRYEHNASRPLLPFGNTQKMSYDAENDLYISTNNIYLGIGNPEMMLAGKIMSGRAFTWDYHMDLMAAGLSANPQVHVTLELDAAKNELRLQELYNVESVTVRTKSNPEPRVIEGKSDGSKFSAEVLMSGLTPVDGGFEFKAVRRNNVITVIVDGEVFAEITVGKVNVRISSVENTEKVDLFNGGWAPIHICPRGTAGVNGGIKGLYTTTSTALIESALEAAAPITAE